MYLGDLCGAPHQVVDIVVELQLPLGCHFFDVGATEHHFVWETRDEERDIRYIYYSTESDATPYCAKVATA